MATRRAKEAQALPTAIGIKCFDEWDATVGLAAAEALTTTSERVVKLLEMELAEKVDVGSRVVDMPSSSVKLRTVCHNE
jgi:hypothetical protein